MPIACFKQEDLSKLLVLIVAPCAWEVENWLIIFFTLSDDLGFSTSNKFYGKLLTSH